MFLETAVHVERLTVLTDEISAEGLALAEMYSNATVMKFPRERYLVESRSWLYSYVQSAQEPTVVHSTFGHLVKFFEMSPQRFNNNLRLVHTQYTANHDWFNHARYHDYPMSFHYLGQRLKSYWRDRRMLRRRRNLCALPWACGWCRIISFSRSTKDQGGIIRSGL